MDRAGAVLTFTNHKFLAARFRGPGEIGPVAFNGVLCRGAAPLRPNYHTTERPA